MSVLFQLYIRESAGLTDMLLPVFGLFDETVAPAVRPWYLEAFECGWSRTRSEGLDSEGIGTEDVDDVA